jgi:Ca-activated chloride channel family protein
MFESTGNEAGETDRTRALLIVSDGENHVEIADMLESARDANIVIFAAGIGEKEGAPIPLYDNNRQIGFKKDRDGEIIETHLEEEALLSLARDGGYFRITRTSSSLLEMKDAIGRLDKRAFDQQLFEEYEERFQWPLALALILLIGERLVSDRRQNRQE